MTNGLEFAPLQRFHMRLALRRIERVTTRRLQHFVGGTRALRADLKVVMGLLAYGLHARSRRMARRFLDEHLRIGNARARIDLAGDRILPVAVG